MKLNSISFPSIILVAGLLGVVACKVPNLSVAAENKTLPAYYGSAKDSTNMAAFSWREYFTDPLLTALIDTALMNNQELSIALQEIEVSRYETMARSGEYLPFGNIGFATGVTKSGRYTWDGVSEEDLKAKTEKFPRFIGDQSLAGLFSWELDVWNKLHHAKNAAFRRYLASIEGRNFVVTNMVAEIANAYYELIILDNQLKIVQQNYDLQQNALDMIKVQKESARVNELAVKRFEAQLISTQNLRYEIQQMIVETENRINFLLGRYPQPIRRQNIDLNALSLPPIVEGIPAQMLANRPDVRAAEQQLEASKLDVKAARANFYPQLSLSANVGLQAFNPLYLINPKSIALDLVGDAVGPIINRKAIRASYYSASAKQLQSVFKYQQTLLSAYLEVVTQLASSQNYSSSFELKAKQVDVLNNSVNISESLFKSARADYTEVLFTEREALEAKMELTEIKKKQVNAIVDLYRSLGGGWR